MPTALLSGTDVRAGLATKTPFGTRRIVPPGNPSIGTFTDAFADLSQWTTITGTPVATGGQARLGRTGAVYDGMRSTAQNLSLLGSDVGFNVAAYASGDYYESFLGLVAPGGNPFLTADLGFFLTGDGAGANLHSNGANTGVGFTFSVASTPWLWLRESGGTVFFESSTTIGGARTSLGSVATPSFASACQFYVAATFSNQALNPYLTLEGINVALATSNPVDAGTLDMSAASDWTGAGAQIFLAGTLDHAGSSDLTGAGAQLVTAGTLDHAGSSDLTGAGVATMSSGTLALDGSSDFTGTGAVTMTGTALDLAGASDWSGAGGLVVLAGALDLSAASDLTGAGGLLILGGVLDHAASSDMTGAGVLAASSGTLALSGLADFAGAGVVAYVAGVLDLAALADFTGAGEIAGQQTDVQGTIIAGWPRYQGRLVLTTAAGTQTYGGFLRNAAGVPTATTTLTGATWQAGFLRGPAPAGQALGPLVVATGGSGQRLGGFLRDAQGALIVTVATDGLGPDGGFYRDGAGRLAVALNQS
jgi:hypothetical protein